MEILFPKDMDTISLHPKNIYKSGELIDGLTTKKSSVIQTEDKRKVRIKNKRYNLNTIISINYRVNSKQECTFSNRGK